MKDDVIGFQPAILGVSDLKISRRRAVAILALIGLLLFSIILWPREFAFVSSGLFMLACLVVSVTRLVALWLFYKSRHGLPEPPLLHLDRVDYPVLSVLLPLYHEAHMVESLIASVSQLNWPKDRIECFLICEPDDEATIQAVREHVRAPFQLFITTGRGPRTKPNALNQALRITRGGIITIFDAEDRPHPMQARAVLEKFLKHPDCGAVQAPLTYHNSADNWLTRQFTLEYDVMFQIWNPALARLGLPFPLGGTSNYVRRGALMSCGGWDSYNVTEDADLTYRLSALGWSLKTVSLSTEEEATSDWRGWRRQRARWIKGYLLSWLVHMRAPWMPSGKMALRRQIALQLTLGLSVLSSLFHLPSLLVLFALPFAIGPSLGAAPLGYEISLACLVFSYGVGMLSGVVSAVTMKRHNLIWHIIFMPAYWLLLFIPALIAMRDAWISPFYWNKTEHGVSSAHN